MGPADAEALVRAARATSYLDDMRAMIAEHGHAVQAVFPTEHDPAGTLGFTYTVGLTGRGRAELWLGTLAPNQAGAILNSLAPKVLDGSLQPGELVGEDLWNVPFRIRGPVSAEDAEANLAREMYPWPTVVEVWQVLWPDEAGRYPDDDGYDDTKFPQRLLPLR